MLETIFSKLINNPKKSLGIVVFVTILLSSFIPSLKIDFSIEHLFSKNDPAVKEYFNFRDLFGREDNVISLIYKPHDHFDKTFFQDLENIIYDIESIPGVLSIISIFSLSDIDSRAWLGDIHNDNALWEKDTVYKKLKYMQSDPSIGSRILSKDLNYGSVIISLRDSENNHTDRTNILEKIKEITSNSSADWIFSGLSVLRTEYVRYMVRDNFLFLPPISLILITILGYIFRNWVFILLPLLTVAITVIWLLGIMGFLGLEINIMTYIVPTLLFIIGISDAIHIQARFRENLSSNLTNPKKAMLLTMMQMSKVILLTSMTTAIGFFALTTSSIRIVQEFGVEISLGVLIAWLVSLLVVPSGIIFFKSYKVKQSDVFFPFLFWLSNIIPRYTKFFIIFPLLVSLALIYKIKDISTDASLMDDLRPKNKLYQDLKLTEKYFGGVLPFEVLLSFKSDSINDKIKLLSVEHLAYLDEIESLLKDELKESRFFSFSTLLQSIEKVRNNEKINYAESIESIFQNRTKNQIKLVSEDKKTLRITGLIENKTSSEMEQIYAKLDSLESTFPEDLSIDYTGTTVVALRTNDYLVESLISSLGLALLMISIIMAIMFKSNSMLFASLITNLIPIFTMLGFLSWIGVSIRPPTAMTFAVALGIAVDDSLHFLLRYRKELNSGFNRINAIKSTIINTGSALLVTTSVLVSGFSVLLLSAFLPTYQFGLLSAGMIGTALLCDLTLLPALCLILPNPNKK